MWPVTVKATNFPGLNLPDVCVNEPKNNVSAFCIEHSNLAMQENVPTGLRDFLKFFCGIEAGPEGK